MLAWADVSLDEASGFLAGIRIMEKEVKAWGLGADLVELIFIYKCFSVSESVEEKPAGTRGVSRIQSFSLGE